MSPQHEMYRTERVLARHLEDTDFDAMFAVYSDPGAMTWVDDGSPIEREECARWIEVTKKNYAERGYGMSALVLLESGEVFGFCGLVHPGGQEVAELKYALLREYWGRGLATEAARGMLQYGLETLGIRRVIATTAPENEPSHRVLGKCGMRHLETVPDADGDLVKTFVWEAGEG